MPMPKRPWYSFESRVPYDSAGVNDAFQVTHFSIARENSDESPYLIPNEWIAGHIGTALRLPVPPFALVRHEGQKGMFASLRFGKRDSTPPDMLPLPCVTNEPELCTGILLFDILIANGDRHRGNIKVDDKNNPREIMIFDHDRALFGCEAGEGTNRLNRKVESLGLSDGTESADSPNCLLTVLNTSKFFRRWIEKISLIPRWFIEDLCDEVNDWLTTDELDAVKYFLVYRCIELETIINKNKRRFTAIHDWGLFV
jgi:hypothetical protein